MIETIKVFLDTVQTQNSPVICVEYIHLTTFKIIIER